MAEIIKGSDVAAKLKAEIKTLIDENDLHPCLALIKVGDDESNAAYERGVTKTCSSLGIEVKTYAFPENIMQETFECEFEKINRDDNVHGILMFRPLPKQLDEQKICTLIDPDKDMDCMSPANWAKLAMGDRDGFYPCTAEACIQILDYMGKEICGSRAVVLGRSQVIGRPVGLMLLARNATVTWCHSKTKDIAAMCKDADILISACGVAEMVDENIASQIASDCAAVDVGINFKDGKMCGDFVFDQVAEHAGWITPVPGGVGAVTSTIMASHVVRAAIKEK